LLLLIARSFLALKKQKWVESTPQRLENQLLIFWPSAEPGGGWITLSWFESMRGRLFNSSN